MFIYFLINDKICWRDVHATFDPIFVSPKQIFLTGVLNFTTLFKQKYVSIEMANQNKSYLYLRYLPQWCCLTLCSTSNLYDREDSFYSNLTYNEILF